MLNGDVIAPQQIRMENASPSWGLMLQSGVGVTCKVGMPIADFLAGELEIPDEIIPRIDVVLVDGMPVDDISSAIIPDGARLALAAGLPGIAGLAMKRGSAVRALRGGITYTSVDVPCLRTGSIVLALYSLVIPMLAPHFLRRGVWVTVAQLRRYARFAPDDICISHSGIMNISAFLESFEEPSDEIIFFTAAIGSMSTSS